MSFALWLLTAAVVLGYLGLVEFRPEPFDPPRRRNRDARTSFVLVWLALLSALAAVWTGVAVLIAGAVA